MINKYDFIFSLGMACSCTTTIRMLGLQDASYPFDWLYGATLEQRVDFLCNNFKDFINLEDLEQIGTRENPMPCRIVRNNRTGMVFNHDFPLDREIDEYYPEVKAKFDRRIKRLYEKIAAANNVLAVCVEVPTQDREVKENIKIQYEKLKSYFNHKVNMCYISCDLEIKQNEILINDASEGLFLVNANYKNMQANAAPYEIEIAPLVSILNFINYDTIYNKECNKYNLVASLGGNCAAAHNLLYYSKRNFSLPFDWLYAKSEKAFQYLSVGFKDGFKDFCKKENLIRVDNYTKHDGYLQYEDSYTDYVFLNHFAQSIESGNEFEIVHQKLKKRIKRLIEKIAISRRVLFLISTYREFQIDPFVNLYSVLVKMFPDTNFDFRFEMFGCDKKEAKIINLYKGVFLINRHERKMLPEDFSETTKEWEFVQNINLTERMVFHKEENLVSVIIPAYNHENYIQDTIKSIINQTYQDIELLIIDDGSKDLTYEKILEMQEDCQKRFKRFEVIKQENKGTTQTINSLILKSKGEYLYLIASDDLAKPIAIEDEFKFLSKNPNYALCVGDNEFVDQYGKKTNWNSDNCTLKTKKEYKTFARLLEDLVGFKLTSKKFSSYKEFYKTNFVPNGYLIRKSIFEKTGLFTDEAPLEDWYLMLQISKYSNLKFLNRVLFSYRLHPTNTAKQREKIDLMVTKTKEYENKILPTIKLETVKKDTEKYIRKITGNKKITIFSKFNFKKRVKLFFYCFMLMVAQIPIVDIFLKRKIRVKLRSGIDKYWR